MKVSFYDKDAKGQNIRPAIAGLVFQKSNVYAREEEAGVELTFEQGELRLIVLEFGTQEAETIAEHLTALLGRHFTPEPKAGASASDAALKLLMQQYADNAAQMMNLTKSVAEQVTGVAEDTAKLRAIVRDLVNRVTKVELLAGGQAKARDPQETADVAGIRPERVAMDKEDDRKIRHALGLLDQEDTPENRAKLRRVPRHVEEPRDPRDGLPGPHAREDARAKSVSPADFSPELGGPAQQGGEAPTTVASRRLFVAVDDYNTGRVLHAEMLTDDGCSPVWLGAQLYGHQYAVEKIDDNFHSGMVRVFKIWSLPHEMPLVGLADLVRQKSFASIPDARYEGAFQAK